MPKQVRLKPEVKKTVSFKVWLLGSLTNQKVITVEGNQGCC